MDLRYCQKRKKSGTAARAKTANINGLRPAVPIFKNKEPAQSIRVAQAVEVLEEQQTDARRLEGRQYFSCRGA
jgi:hypothetical protein